MDAAYNGKFHISSIRIVKIVIRDAARIVPRSAIPPVAERKRKS